MSLTRLSQYGITKVAVSGGEPIEGVPFYGIASQTLSSTSGFGQRLGWSFTVGDDALLVNTLRCFAPTTGKVERVRIHRVSDGELMATADIDVVSSAAWLEATVAPVVLAAGASYTVSSRLTDGTTRSVYRNPSGLTFFAGITKTGNVFGSNDNLPTSSTGNVYTFSDFGFVE